MVAPDDGPSLPRPGRHGGAAPVTFRRRGSSAVPCRFCSATSWRQRPREKPCGLAQVLPSPGVETGRTWRWRAGGVGRPV